MTLESFPNELLLDLFQYFSFVHLIQSFFNLNSRFNELICKKINEFHLDFRRISKTNFDQICQNYVPSFIDKIVSLQLSDDDNTPQQINYFFLEMIFNFDNLFILN
jgi:hypothetical protein